MEVDISKDILKRLEESFGEKIKSNKKIKYLLKKLENDEATYKEANEYAIELGQILAETYKENIKSDELPNGRMYYNIGDKTITPTMKNNYELISEYSKDVQTLINKKAGLGLNGIKAPLNKDRIHGIVQRLADEEDYEKTKWILNENMVNFSQSIVDDTVRKNAESHFKLGLEPKIYRESSGKCCKWCSKLDGTYNYFEVKNAGNDVFRRHRNCRCTVEYVPGGGKYKSQNVHNKDWSYFEEDDIIKKRIKDDDSGNDLFISNVRKKLLDSDIEYNPVKKSKIKRTEKEIIERVSRGDETNGSCSSVALAYIGNKAGYDVSDFRGGKSEEFFCSPYNIVDIASFNRS